MFAALSGECADLNFSSDSFANLASVALSNSLDMGCV
jgi:hypothetical protein